MLPSGLCHNHDPDLQAKRAARRSREDAEYAQRVAEMRKRSEEWEVAQRERNRWMRRRALMQEAERLLKRKAASEPAVARAKGLLELVRALEVADPYVDEPSYPETGE